MENRQAILSAKDVEIQFSLRGQRLTAIRGCSLDLYEGETLAIVGESGSGKSVFTKSFIGMAQAKQPFPGISLAVVDDQVERALASQAADELINISGVRAAFVVYGEGGGSCVSARSYGQLNVQMVMEKVGGGGSLTGAGAQFKDKTPDEVAQLLLDAIGEYLKEIEDEDKRHKEEQTWRSPATAPAQKPPVRSKLLKI